ncbi:winged helix-turn-helix transcriptional regulator [Methanoculleus bourgensis]|uniref:Transcriptional regulator n=2 Tax=Methanoculleus bourgensis TaxID=83986 RepID=I7KB74_METBM|nr:MULTISPECIES: winged helix-turn-helix transcriptional regulator [Methanoculleus]MBT0731996.1 winged helix-turn-helix transcriptional regulator [Methanoculleus bourgensis]NMA88279.1 winged helix-turn-helix transcriptional regulator [Methanoculleus bourgensis]CCJ35281.1 putative transcriptional regulator [Methanoculleus bourgensis MS2]SAI89136.1 putative transcriptional regulator [Methanoculleus bourgensis]
MTNLAEDPLYVILRSKRESTRFQILVEIAEHQPSIRQQEIAEKLGVTPQAVSEYIREMVDDGLVTAHGRGRYEVTKSGIEWVLRHAEVLESYARHITRDVIQQVAVWTAIARNELKKGDTVGVFMQDGWLYATKEQQSAMGQATMDARPGEDVGVAHLNGIIDHEEGAIHVCKVPRIERGGSRQVRTDLLRAAIRDADMVASVGLESYVALKKAGIEPDMFFGSREGVIEAAFHGRQCAILIVDEEFTDFLKRLETVGLTYIIHDIAP